MKKTGKKFGSLFLALALTITQFSNTASTALAASNVQITVNANKKVDVALAVGSTTVDYSSFESRLREAIGDRIPQSSLNIMASTSVDTSTSSDFEWLKFDHSLNNWSATDDFIDATGSQSNTVYDNADSHVILDTTNGSKLTFNGYGRSAYSDFMLLENDQTTNKTFQFDIKEYFAADALYNIGFFFNSNISYDTEKYTGTNAMYDAYQADELLLNGYIMTLEYNGYSTTGIAIYKVKDLKLKSFHNDSNAQMRVGGNVSLFTKIASLTASTTDSYKASDDLRKFRVEVTPTSVAVYYAGFDDETHAVTNVSNESMAQEFDENSEGYKAFASTSYESLTALNFTLASDTSNKITTVPLDTTVKSGGSDFGPMVKYGSHSCSRLTKVELSNLSMATDVVRSLNEVIREPQWSKDSSKFLVNLNEDPIEDFDNVQITGELLNRLQNDDIHYVGWCSDKNAAKSSEFLIKNDLKGDIVNINDADTDTLDKQIKQIADLIVARYQKESENNANVITAGKTITFDVTGAETTNTADDTYPEGKWTIKFYDTEGTLISTTTVSNLMPEFVVAGTYEIYYCGTQADNLVKTIILNAPPKADYEVQVASGEAITATLTNTSVDLEKSVLTSKWTYSEVGSVSSPTELTQDTNQNTTLTMEEGKIYLVSLTVTDKWGASATTSRQVSYDPSESALPIADFTLSVDQFVRNASGESITGSNIITVTDKSYDLYGKAVSSTFKFTTGAAITMEAVAGQSGIYTIDTSALNAGTYSIYLTTNNGIKDSRRVAHTFKIVKDEAGPTATANVKAGNINLPTTAITLNFSDNGGSGVLKQKTVMSTSMTAPTEAQWAEVPYSYYDAKSISVDNMEGTYYIHYLAEDVLGNVNTASVGPYTIDTKAPSIASKVSPTANMKDVAVAPQIQFTVSETVTKGDGYLYIRKASDNSVVYSIPASSKTVRLNGKTISIEMLTSLANETEYYISLSKGFVVDSVGNEIKAFDGKGNWNFTTKKAIDDIKVQEIKIIGIDVSQTISNGNGGTEESETKAQAANTENNFIVNVYEDSSSDSTIHANVKPNFSVDPAKDEVDVTASNGITCEKKKDGTYDVIIPSGTLTNNKVMTITVKGETYTLKFVSYGTKWGNVTTEVKATGIAATIPKMSLTNAIDISDITSTSSNVNIAIRFEADTDETKLNATDVQSLKTAVAGNLKFIDLKLIKSVTIDNGTPTEVNIHNTLAPLKVRLTLPIELQGNQYAISIYRIHNDVVTLLNSTLVNDGKEIEFESDAYSTYAIKYDSEGGVGGGVKIVDNTVSETPITFEKTNPKDATISVDKAKTVTAITLNGQTVAISNYKAGNSEIVLGKDKLTDLKEGTYSVVVTYSDKATVTFTINVVAYNEATTLTDVPVFYMTKNMSIGNKFALTTTGINKYAKVTYKTSNSKVVSVSSKGTLVAKANGTADVTATITQKGSQYKINIKIKVQKGMPFNRTIAASDAISINTSLPVLNIYKRVRIGNKTKVQIKNIATDAVVSYSSDIKSVATVSKNGTITAIAKGECVVTTKIKQNGKTYCYKVLVRVPEEK